MFPLWIGKRPHGRRFVSSDRGQCGFEGSEAGASTYMAVDVHQMIMEGVDVLDRLLAEFAQTIEMFEDDAAKRRGMHERVSVCRPAPIWS